MINGIYQNFCCSEYMINLSKSEKNKYNKKYFHEYFETNIFFKKYYYERYNDIRNVIRYWKLRNNEDD